MLKIYSKSEVLPKPVVESHNEVFFARNLKYADLTPADFPIISNIDKAVPYEADYFKTPFGLAQIKHLSTGCKTVLNAIHFPDKIFNFTECGGNAISELIRVSAELKDDIVIYLPRYRDIDPMTAPIMLNNEIAESSDEFYDLWHKGGEFDD
jgi:hypothetical protein